MTNNEIEKLDFVLDLVLKSKGFVISNDLHGSEFYSDNENDRMESDFLKMVSEFKRIGNANVVNEGKGLERNGQTEKFKSDGGFKEYYKNERTKSIKETERQELKDEIDRLTLEVLKLQKTDLKNKVWIAIIFFISGAILSNVKEILILLKILPPE
ncbi:hypothetical protein MTsPCn9_11300 [Croceitalea sp. MTPC9]|uniref:hypothetical protein n=1 Tax=unclassified Croceitalea TaxID=2632280 RepID=UPI002B3EDF08|nr:hypothetical protein MTsPCn6_25940 [Croceitalea sp. MTPC6]GMN16194.1 hypothetical protein MTsPCn9_11300 [Croceitalea sp. MTPC9]